MKKRTMFLIENMDEFKNILEENECPIPHSIWEFAFSHRNEVLHHINSIKFTNESMQIIQITYGFPDKYLCEHAAFCGEIHLLEYLHRKGYFWNENTCTQAALMGHINCLNFAHKNGCPWDKNVYYFATSNDQCDCLVYAHMNRCKIPSDFCETAVRHNSFKCLSYAVENNFPINFDKCLEGAKSQKMMEYLCSLKK